jgi:asparagine synthase (glutamine-hydrolysing)
MCGICGIYGNNADIEVVRKMTSVLSHRGPDGEGFLERKNLVLGHRRLSIIDLSERASQPIGNEAGDKWLIFNGEIYNFKDLRRDLIKHGHKFISDSDSEVIIHCYEQWGEDCLNYLRGMFAFAIYDEEKDSLFLARDRLGEKPLYYLEKDGCFVFASELKAIIGSGLSDEQIDPGGLHHFLSFYSVPSPKTMVSGVNSLLPGHKITVMGNKGIIVEKYWSLPAFDEKTTAKIELEPAKEELRELMLESVRMRLISDVPLGAFLSGGIDSSIVVGLMSLLMSHPVNTYSVGFIGEGSEISELKYAKVLADRFCTDHSEVILAGKDVLNDLDSIVSGIDQPSGDGVNTYFVSKAAKEGMTVALSGLGGDELFAGYPHFISFRSQHEEEQCANRIFRHSAKRIAEALSHDIKKRQPFKNMRYFGENINRKYSLSRSVFWEDEKLRLYSDNYLSDNLEFLPDSSLFYSDVGISPDDVVRSVSKLELMGYMPNTLLRDTDAMSMAHSLEVRVPLIDHKLVEYVYLLPSEYKLNRNISKYLLIETFRDLIPKEILERKKTGFEIPMGCWLKNELKEIVDDVFSKDSIANRNIFNFKEMQSIYKRFYEGRAGYMLIWMFVILELWLRKFL